MNKGKEKKKGGRCRIGMIKQVIGNLTKGRLVGCKGHKIDCIASSLECEIICLLETTFSISLYIREKEKGDST